MLTVYINFASLPSWLALNPLQTMVEQTGVVLDWYPLIRTEQAMPGKNIAPDKTQAAEDPLADYKARRARAKSRYVASERARMCERLGIDADSANRSFDPLMLSSGLLWLKTLEPQQRQYFDYCRAAFRRAFIECADVESVAGIKQLFAGLADQSGSAETDAPLTSPTNMDEADGFHAFAIHQTDALNHVRTQLPATGILHTPAFVLDGEVFHGREHIPLLTWMLQGRRGAPPA